MFGDSVLFEKIDEERLADFFSEIIAEFVCPLEFQIAPEFLNFRLSNQNLSALANKHDNFAIAMFEYNLVNLVMIARDFTDNMMLFNRRFRQELPDNLRASANSA